jgi:hypothetical protein
VSVVVQRRGVVGRGGHIGGAEHWWRRRSVGGVRDVVGGGVRERVYA